MSIDFFGLPGEPKVDKSDWFASISCISGCFNGAHLVYSVNLDRDTCLLKSKTANKVKFLETWMADAIRHCYKAVSFA